MDEIAQLQAIMQELSIREIESFSSLSLRSKALAQRLVSNPDYQLDDAEKEVFDSYLTRLTELREICKSLPTGYRLQDDVLWDKLTKFLSNPQSEPFPFEITEPLNDTPIDTSFTSFIELLDLSIEKRNCIEDEIQSIRDNKPRSNWFQPGLYAMVKKYGLAILKPVREDEPALVTNWEPAIEPVTQSTHNSKPDDHTVKPKPQGLQIRRSFSGMFEQ